LQNATDADTVTSMTLTCTGTGVNKSIAQSFGPLSSVFRRYKSLILKIDLSVTTNNLAGGASDPVFKVDVQGPNGVFTTLLSLNHGVTQARTTLSVDLIAAGFGPVLNLANFQFSISESSASVYTSGSVVAQVFDMRAELEE